MNDLLVARLFAQGGFVTALEAHTCGYTNLGLHRLVATGDLFRARAGCFVDGRLLNGAGPEKRHALTGPVRPRTVPGLRVHPEVPDSVSRQLDGDRAVHPAMAIVQSAALAGITAGVAAADAALHSGQVTRKDLEIALRVARLGPGRADAQAAVDLADGLTESPGESWTRCSLRQWGCRRSSLRW